MQSHLKMTETTIDLRYLAETQPSVCIPRVFNNISETRVRQVFDELGLGKISRIDVKERTSEKGESFKRVYVHFEKWFWNDDAQAVRRKLISGKEIKIVYDNPWFWKVSASKWSPSEERGAPHNIPRTHIDFDYSIDRRPDNRDRRPDNRDRRPDNRDRRPDNRDRRQHNKPLDNPDHLTHLHQVKVDYRNINVPLLKKKQKKILSEEIVEENVMSEEDRNACEELYGDLQDA